MEPQVVFGQPSYKIESDLVEAWVTEVGGQMAPILFRLPNGPVEPFSIAPWAEDGLELPPILNALRGDFFCLPFGGNEEIYEGEQHPIHGETANLRWSLDAIGDGKVDLSLATAIRQGQVRKQIHVNPGQTAIYQRHTVSAMAGKMCFGHHAM